MSVSSAVDSAFSEIVITLDGSRGGCTIAWFKGNLDDFTTIQH